MGWKPPTEGSECRECGAIVRGSLGFPKHLEARHSLSTRQYYDRHLRGDGEGACRCGRPTGFINMTHGYRKHCSHACAMSSPETGVRRRRTNLKRHGVENPFSRPEVREKIRLTMMERHGVEHPMRSPAVLDRIRATNREYYGVDWQVASGSTRAESAATNLKRHGVENPFSSPDVRERIRATNLERFGTEYPLQAEANRAKARETMERRHGAPHAAQVPAIRRRQASAAKFTTPIEVDGVTIDCQGTYEQRFVREHLASFGFNGADISQDVAVPYVDHRGKHRRYIPDFFHVPSGTLIEIKSTWTLDRNGRDPDEREIVLAKSRGAEAAGHKLLFVMMDKDGISWVARSSEELLARVKENGSDRDKA